MEVEKMNENTIKELADILNSNNSIELKYKGLYYTIFKSAELGYVINAYSLNEKDEDGDYLESNLIDGCFCNGSAKNAIEFILSWS